MMVAKVAQSGRPRGQPRQWDGKDIRPLSAVRVGAQKHTPNQTPPTVANTRPFFAPPRVPGRRGVSNMPTRRHRRWRIHVPRSSPAGPLVGRMLLRPYTGYMIGFAKHIRPADASGLGDGLILLLRPPPRPPGAPIYIMYRPRPGGATIARPVFHTPRKEHPEKQTRIFVH